MRLERVRIENYRSIKDAEFAPTDLLSVRSARQLEDFAAIADIVTG
jgi:AAA15 family ATPase/GTPase